jgi:TonB family protein
MIIIPANSIKPNSSITEFNVELSEYYSKSDIILKNLTTRTNSELLETGGMINIEIFNNEKKCTLNKEIKIGFPVIDEMNNKMEIFKGKISEDDIISWEQITTEEKENNSTLRFIVVEEMPKFQGGGIEVFQDYIQSNIVYPPIAIDSGYCGRVMVNFTVGIDGNITDSRILRGSHPAFNTEVLKAISLSPEWTPGKQKEQNVPIQFTIPVSFMLDYDCKMYDDSLNTNNDFYSSVNDSTFNNSSINQISHYIFNSLSLGWVNCDWYVFKKLPKTNQKIVASGFGHISTHLIFDDYNVVLSGNKTGNLYNFNGVPKNKKITAIALKRIKDKTFIAIKESTTSDKTLHLDNFSEVSFDELKNKLDNIYLANN